MDKPSVLLVDPSAEVLAEFSQDSDKGLVKILTAENRPDAQLLIADKANFLAAVVFNTKSCEPLALPLIRFTKSHRPATPVYLTLDEDEKDPEPDILKGMQITHIFRKPVDRQDLMNKIFPYTYFEMEKALEVAKSDTTAAGASVTAEDQEMHSIAARDFLCGSKSFFDVFVRLGSGKYIKLLKAGDAFDAERVKDYITKGVTHFYIKNEAQEIYLQYCDSLTGIILHKKGLAVSVKSAQVMNYGKETADFLKARGFNSATLQTAKQFVSHSGKLVQALKPEKNAMLKRFLANAALCEHGTGVTMMVGMMLEKLGFKDEKVINTLALAAFMHDIGLMQMPPKFLEEDTTDFTPEELALYETHPIVGYEMAKSIRLISPIVPATILEHHERRTGRGFPRQLSAGTISQVSEIIAIVDTFSILLKRALKNPGLDPVQHMEKVVFNEFSFPVIDAFQKAFFGAMNTQLSAADVPPPASTPKT